MTATLRRASLCTRRLDAEIERAARVDRQAHDEAEAAA
jgi:hypothetical protein